jgi:hypothetical protein
MIVPSFLVYFIKPRLCTRDTTSMTFLSKRFSSLFVGLYRESGVVVGRYAGMLWNLVVLCTYDPHCIPTSRYTNLFYLIVGRTVGLRVLSNAMERIINTRMIRTVPVRRPTSTSHR